MRTTRPDPMDPMERALRDDAARHLDDDGFTSAVLAALPPERAARPAWLRAVILLGGAIGGTALAALLLPGEVPVMRGASDLVAGAGMTPAAITALAASALVALIAAVTASSVD